jgi:hypothetical protein
MSWEQRLREMVLAGGALAVACSSGTTAPADASAPTDSSGSTTPDASPIGMPDASIGTPDASNGTRDGSAGTPPDANSFFCCNANPDPCCPYINCGAPLTAACACALEGGTWLPEPGQTPTCSADAGSQEAGPK